MVTLPEPKTLQEFVDAFILANGPYAVRRLSRVVYAPGSIRVFLSDEDGKEVPAQFGVDPSFFLGGLVRNEAVMENFAELLFRIAGVEHDSYRHPSCGERVWFRLS